MATVNYTLRVDEVDKNNAEQVFKNLGMSFATGINIYLKTVGRQQKIPFNMDLNDTASKNQAKRKFKQAFEKAQQESILNGTDDMSMDEINDIIAECRREG